MTEEQPGAVVADVPSPLRVVEPAARPPPPDPAQVESGRGLSHPDWQVVQTALAMQGFDAGNPDGRPGDQTRQAIGDWQSREGLPATRYLAAGSAASRSGPRKPEGRRGVPGLRRLPGDGGSAGWVFYDGLVRS